MQKSAFIDDSICHASLLNVYNLIFRLCRRAFLLLAHATCNRCICLPVNLQVDMHEVLIDNMQRLDVRDCIYLSENVIEPVYQLMMFYLRALCLDYEKLADEEKAQMVPELSQLFGEDTERLPADCVYKSEDYDYTASFDDAEGDDNMLDEYGDETDFGKWSFGNSFAQVGAMI